MALRGRVNSSEILALSEEERLRLAAETVHLIRSLDAEASTIVSLDQPWGEYMGRRPVDFPPLHFADALIRSGLDLKALMLELNLGCYRGATLPRTAVELSRLLDYWNLLGLPLMMSLSVPSASQSDRLAQRRTEPLVGPWTPQVQQAWISRLVPLILAKPGVQGFVWNQLRDDVPHDFPHAGLFDHHGLPKPALKTLTSIRQACVK